MIAHLEFVWFMIRPRAVRAWWRLGGFECACWSADYLRMQLSSSWERFTRERLQS